MSQKTALYLFMYLLPQLCRLFLLLLLLLVKTRGGRACLVLRKLSLSYRNEYTLRQGWKARGGGIDMSQKRPYEAVTGRQEIPGVGGESGTMAVGGDEEPRAKVARGSDHQWVRNGYGERWSEDGVVPL